MNILRISPHAQDVGPILLQSTDYMHQLYPIQNYHLDSIEELSATQVCMVGAYDHATLTGVGAVRIIDNDPFPYGEISRVFVLPAYRGKGIAKQIMRALEAHALNAGINICRLETGTRQPEAIALYTKLGYAICRPFGKHTADPLSVFMEKILTSG